MFKIQLMYPKLKMNVYFIFLNIGDLTFGITLVLCKDTNLFIFKIKENMLAVLRG
jgi:hypothetical protein